jgi:hypothetical protein
VTRKTFILRNLSVVNIVDGEYLCDGGAERLIQEWKIRRGKWIDERDGVEQEPLDPAIDNLFRLAGSSAFSYQEIPDINWHEKFLLLHTLQPFESDGPEDTEEWNLFDSYLNAQDDEESLKERHNLSSILQRWEYDVVCMSLHYPQNYDPSHLFLHISQA